MGRVLGLRAEAGLGSEATVPLTLCPVLGTPGPYTLQGILGCELSPDNSSVPTALFALNGEDFMEFHPENGSWTGDWPEALSISKQWEKKAEVVSKEKTFLLSSCPQRLLDHLERSRRNLEWKGECPPLGLSLIFGDRVSLCNPCRPRAPYGARAALHREVILLPRSPQCWEDSGCVVSILPPPHLRYPQQRRPAHSWTPLFT